MKNHKVSTVDLITNQSATGAGPSHEPFGINRSYQANGQTTAGAGAATVKVQISDDNVNWSDLSTINLVLSTTTAIGIAFSDTAFRYVRGNVTAISGTGATTTLILGSY